METWGNAALHVAFLVTLYSIVISIVGAKKHREDFVVSGRNAVWAVGLLVAAASAMLIGCLLTGRYHVEYVHQYSNSTMPFFYKVASFWGGQDGSLLFWLLILAAFSSVVAWQNRKKNREFLPYIVATLMTIALFFLGLIIFAANPFDTLPFTVTNGKGLNPLLQNYYMMIHPPSLYLGYVGMSVPFAFAIAALATGRLDNHWILQIRKWVLFAWFFLSCGNLLGASWAYEVLGWGGYWAWDPVENAAFMPWLTATAFLHSVIIQEKRGMLKTWNMALVILSFLLTLTGTFLTRSGIISSVHSFAQSSIGYYFLGFLGFVAAVSTGLLIARLPQLRSKHTLDSFASREATFLFNNLVLVGAAFAVLWGTLFPVLSEWIRGTKISVGPPFFNSIMIPIGLVLLLLTGIGPIVGWRKSTPEQLRRNFLWPVAAAMVTTVLTVAFLSRDVAVVTSFSFCAFVLATIVFEYQQGISVRRRTLGEDWATALLRLVASNRRRYGGYIVHLGIVLLFIGFTGNAFKKELEVKLKPGESASLGRYTLRYDQLTSKSDAHKETIEANVAAFITNEPYALMKPARVFYRSQQDSSEAPQPSTEVAIKRSLREDLYLALLTYDPQNDSAFIKIVINPLVQFLWIGGLFIILGTLIGIWPSSSHVESRSVARAAAILLAFITLSFGALTSPAKAEPPPGSPEEIERISKKLKCECGCNFADLASCTCGEWAIPAKEEIRSRLARGEDEATILKYFIAQYGEKVLTSPVRQGFNYAGWIVPSAGLLLAAALIIGIVRRWVRSAPTPTTEQASVSPPALSAEDERLRRELDQELYGTSNK